MCTASLSDSKNIMTGNIAKHIQKGLLNIVIRESCAKDEELTEMLCSATSANYHFNKFMSVSAWLPFVI